jgi:hypothetical protein
LSCSEDILLELRRGSAVRVHWHVVLLDRGEATLGSAELERAVLTDREEPRPDMALHVFGTLGAKPKEGVLHHVGRARFARDGRRVTKQRSLVLRQRVLDPTDIREQNVARSRARRVASVRENAEERPLLEKKCRGLKNVGTPCTFARFGGARVDGVSETHTRRAGKLGKRAHRCEDCWRKRTEVLPIMRTTTLAAFASVALLAGCGGKFSDPPGSPSGSTAGAGGTTTTRSPGTGGGTAGDGATGGALPAPAFCEPGSIVDCKCDGAHVGEQVCRADGSEYLPCACAPARVSCRDGMMNDLETDIDCGGPECEPCVDEQLCHTDSDCVSRHCTSGICGVMGCAQTATCTPRCDDALQNGGESDVDCGGVDCPACAPGKVCNSGSDCLSRVCAARACQTPNCYDTVKNGDETDIDCGGASCPPCNGCLCASNSDCFSGVCIDCTCRAPTCTDQVKNGGETDVDCGGTCPSCLPGHPCVSGKDCTTGWCPGGVCVDPDCLDGEKNGAETDVDCGGPCIGCTIGRSCSVNSDCFSMHCAAGVCASAT